MDEIIEMAKSIQADHAELTLDECVNIAADVRYERGAWNDFDREDIEHEAFEY